MIYRFHLSFSFESFLAKEVELMLIEQQMVVLHTYKSYDILHILSLSFINILSSFSRMVKITLGTGREKQQKHRGKGFFLFLFRASSIIGNSADCQKEKNGAFSGNCFFSRTIRIYGLEKNDFLNLFHKIK